MKKIFVLGCERSGSTWLSNVLDAHPDVEFFMEPFADYARIFPAVPERNVYLDEPDQAHIDEIERGYAKLHGLKYPLFYKSGRPLFLKIWDRALVTLDRKISWRLTFTIPMRIQRYHLLHLNNETIPLGRQTRKHKKPGIEVTKELRLNFKTGLISKVFPDAKYLVTIRHPGAQIDSIQRLFAKNSLGELKKNLETFIEDIGKDSRFAKYKDVIRQFHRGDDLQVTLVLWWLINYEVLLEDLNRFGLEFRVVYHEDLSAHAEDEVTRILDFIELDMVPEINDYVIFSSKPRGNIDVVSNVDTRRDSATYYREAISAVEPGLKKKIRDVVRYHGGLLAPRLRHYLSKFEWS
jgi:hypothetical protein